MSSKKLASLKGKKNKEKQGSKDTQTAAMAGVSQSLSMAGSQASPSGTPGFVGRHDELLGLTKPAGNTVPGEDGKPSQHAKSRQLRLEIKAARNLSTDSNVQPVITVDYDAQEARTTMAMGSEPVWNQTFAFDVVHDNIPVNIWVYDTNSSVMVEADGDEQDELCLASAVLPLQLVPGAPVDKWITLERHVAFDLPAPQVHISYSYEIKTAHKLSPADFELVATIGRGSFGKVMVVRKKDTGRIYAMKKLIKHQLLERGEIDHTISERNILAKNTNPFLVSLKFSFQTPDKVYFVLDYVSGGELFVHLQREGVFSEERSRYYASMLILGLEHLHSFGIIYRDLKPENILIDQSGYIKLTDFGLCKQTKQPDEKTATFCGTPEYMAPEILQQRGYGMAVDWWTVGTLLYEMLAGIPPFYDEDTQLMYRNILFAPLEFTPEIRPKAQLLIARMLDRNPETRLGTRGVGEIKSQPFFEHIDWQALLEKRVKMPWKPRVRNELDVSNFDPEFTSQAAVDTFVMPSQLAPSVERKFMGFTFVAQSELNDALHDTV